MMLWVKTAQLLLVWSQRSSSEAPLRPPGTPSTVPTLLKPLLPNGAELKSSGTPGPPVLFRPANADSVVMLPAMAVASGMFPPATAALNWEIRFARTPAATGVLKQVGEAPGARIIGPTNGFAAKFAATRQFA